MPDGQLWIWKPFIPYLEPVAKYEQIVITNDCVKQPGENLTIVSDAAVHVDTFKVFGAW